MPFSSNAREIIEIQLKKSKYFLPFFSTFAHFCRIHLPEPTE
ncbi:hypothetical protein MtrunA17_Chr3g0124391 [Medicago truncatula]|uniref:Uncharacterized protein n=1 Tax=Medicago truncatula TaxID=3880 RepID=A0A396IZ69_MEDTR|nr:hypothetical protein MtrunA17_Chr3g0124391 [Medicago truncatula]